MHHAPAHHHRTQQHLAGQPRRAQRLQAALGQREVDRTPAEETRTARIGPLLEHLQRKAMLRQLPRQQGAHQAAADEGDAGSLRHVAHRRRDRATVPQAARDCNPRPRACYDDHRSRCTPAGLRAK
jgi:hypothetical protein